MVQFWKRRLFYFMAEVTVDDEDNVSAHSTRGRMKRTYSKQLIFRIVMCLLQVIDLFNALIMHYAFHLFRFLEAFWNQYLRCLYKVLHQLMHLSTESIE
ncbi:unnamed protein product [Cercopithifilaria johnstoni]|uniref:Uncharacterized protein n=1 Tax=Cercopithifilaria johnstoni TaxID=2874296 RepID=A0A8J2MFC1_9BILA|nr:unnamed protein product [Cercopithifilaria johnstoni]